MKAIQIQSQIGSDGVLTPRVPLGAEEAAQRVLVMIAPIAETKADAPRDETERHCFVEETYGSCAGLGLERPDQGEFERRDDLK
ncbi:MAG TPA: hypothetical protein VLI90_09655 [Tepidisphaeraceae bacterium]|nr:hypothetical protein [Tepidisphaeraceae bacterium]